MACLKRVLIVWQFLSILKFVEYYLLIAGCVCYNIGGNI